MGGRCCGDSRRRRAEEFQRGQHGQVPRSLVSDVQQPVRKIPQVVYDETLLDDFDYDAMYAKIIAREATIIIGTPIQLDRSIMLHFLRELWRNSGFSLTKVSVPAYVMERRSFLEMLADFVRPSLMLAIPEGEDAIARLINVVRFYLGGFSSMQTHGQHPRKPFNPVMGEIFRCIWPPPPRFKEQREEMDKDESAMSDSNPTSESIASNMFQPFKDPAEPAYETPDEGVKDEKEASSSHRCGMLLAHDSCVSFFGEQVSHDPPVSAFHAKCPAGGVSVNGSISLMVTAQWSYISLKAIDVSHVGHIFVHDLVHNDTYKLSLPDVKASYVSEPQKRRVDYIGQGVCETKEHTAIINFVKAKKESDRFTVQGDIFKKSDLSPCGVTINGRWNGELRVIRDGRSTVLLDSTVLHREQKQCLPIASMSWLESRRVWRKVIRAMEENRLDDAVDEKRQVEERHRRIKLKPVHFRRSKHQPNHWRWKVTQAK
jgi:hypothetical protein